MKLPIGTKIRFTDTIFEVATSDQPAIVYANAGELGEIVGHDAKEGYLVTSESHNGSFGAARDEFEVKL